MQNLQTMLQSNDSFDPVVSLGSFSSPSSQDGTEGLFGALFFNSRAHTGEILLELKQRGVCFPQQGYRLVKFTITEPALENMPIETRHHGRMRLHLALRQAVAQALENSNNGGYGILMFGYLFLLWFCDSQDHELEAACRQVQSWIPFRCRGIESAYYRDIEEMQEASRLFSKLEDSLRFYYGHKGGRLPIYSTGDTDMQRLNDSTQRVQFEQQMDERAERICGALSAMDRSATVERFREALAALADNCQGLPYPNTLRNSILRFWESLQYHLADEDVIPLKYLRTVDLSRSFMGAEYRRDLVDKAEEAADVLLEQMARQKAESRALLLSKMADYVRSIALQPEACLTLVAKEFSMEPREIATQFRRAFGIGVRDLIHQTRIAAAKQLLANPDLAVQDIARMTGYSSLTTMYRAFAKYEGAAPGKLRGK